MWTSSAHTYAFSVSIYYVLSYKVHTEVIGIVSVWQLLCERRDLRIHRACLSTAWFYLLRDMGANGH